MKKRLVIPLMLVLLLLALFLTMAGYAQGPGGNEKEKEEEGGAGVRGLADPPPAGYTVRYMFTGAADDDPLADPDTRATVVHCTNHGSSSVNVWVEISDFDKNPTITGTVPLAPSWTATFSSQNTEVYAEDVILSPHTDDINQGSGRILVNSSSTQIICTAQVVDPTNDPPEYMINLDLFRQ